VDNEVDDVASGPGRGVVVRRRAVAVLIEQAAALAHEGFFVESSALMNAARALMGAPSTDAMVIEMNAARLRRDP
jgi:hypothetical protein